jgi:hypothetical protein
MADGRSLHAGQQHKLRKDKLTAAATAATTAPATATTLTAAAVPLSASLQLRCRWYPTPEEGNNKGLLLLVSTAKDGALSGGPKFMRVRPCWRMPGCSAGIALPAARLRMHRMRQ